MLVESWSPQPLAGPSAGCSKLEGGDTIPLTWYRPRAFGVIGPSALDIDSGKLPAPLLTGALSIPEPSACGNPVSRQAAPAGRSYITPESRRDADDLLVSLLRVAVRT